MLLGLTEPTRGVVRVVGLDPTREPLAVKRQVGYLPDNVGFYGGMTGRENLRYTAKLNGIAAHRGGGARSTSCSREVRLTTPPTSRPRRTRAACASGSASPTRWSRSPSVLILDEPTIAIDPAGVEELLELLRRLVAERNLTVLLSLAHPGPGPGRVRPGRVLLGRPARRRRDRSTELARGTDRTIQLEVGVDGDAGGDRPRRASALPGVRSVEPSPEHDRYRVVTSTDDVAGPLATALAAAGLSARPPASARRRPAGALSPLRPGGHRWPRPLTPPAPPTTRHAARRAEKAPSGGWRTIAAKELADHLGSVRFIVLLVVVGDRGDRADVLHLHGHQRRRAAGRGPARAVPRAVHRRAPTRSAACR